jgi:nucleotide-binding universal stress UspA family protein
LKHLFAQIARRFDLSLVQQSDPEQPGHENVIITAAIFDSGRPVLIVPYIQTDGIRLNRVMICWDGSRNAARAIADAQPFLTRAKAIELVTVVSADIKSGEMGDADIARHLARHYPKVEVENITATDLDVPNAILSHAADTSADFIVMGGYGHGRHVASSGDFSLRMGPDPPPLPNTCQAGQNPRERPADAVTLSASTLRQQNRRLVFV